MFNILFRTSNTSPELTGSSLGGDIETYTSLKEFEFFFNCPKWAFQKSRLSPCPGLRRCRSYCPGQLKNLIFVIRDLNSLGKHMLNI